MAKKLRPRVMIKEIADLSSVFLEINFTYVRYSATKLADKVATIGSKA